MFFPTKVTVKLAIINTGHAKVIGIISCHYPKCPSMYPVVQVYYFPSHPSNTISLGDVKFCAGFQNVTSEPLEHCDFLTLNVILRDYPTRLNFFLTIFKSKL